MKRGRTNTERWMWRLILAAVISCGLHALPLVAAIRLGTRRPLDIEYRITAVEIGLEQARPGAATPPRAVPPTPATPSPPSPVVTQPAQPPEPRVAHTRPAARDPDEPGGQIHTQPIERVRRPPRVAATVPARESQRDGGAPRPVPNNLPSFATAAGDLAPMVPRGALVTLLLHSDRIRSNPNARSVRRLLTAIPDWEAILGGTALDPINDLDELLLAAANPFGADNRAPDWFVLAKGAHGSDLAIRRAVERMAEHDAPHAPSPVAPPSLDAGMGEPTTVVPGSSIDPPDAGHSIWESTPSGAEIVNLERYGTRRSFVMLGDGMAAVALPGQVDALLSALARRGDPLATADPRLTLLIEAEGVRNLISFNTWRGPFPMPRRASLGLYESVDGANIATGATELVSVWQYDNAAEATRGQEMLEYSRGRWRLMIAHGCSDHLIPMHFLWMADWV